MNVAGVVLGRWRLVRNTLTRRSRAGRAPGSGWCWRRGHRGASVRVPGAFATFAAGACGVESAASLLAAILTAALVALIVFDLTTCLRRPARFRSRFAATCSDRPDRLLALKLVDALPRTSPVLVILLIPAVVGFAAAAPLQFGVAAGAVSVFAMWLIPYARIGGCVDGAAPRARTARAGSARAALDADAHGALARDSFLLPKAGSPRAWEALRWTPARRSVSPPCRRRIGSRAVSWPRMTVTSPVHSAARPAAGGGADRRRRCARGGGARSGDGARSGRVERGAARKVETAHRIVEPRGAVLELAWRDVRLFARDWTVLSDLWPHRCVDTAAARWGAFARPSATHPGRSMLTLLAIALGYEIAARSIPFEKLGFTWTRLAPLPRRAGCSPSC